VAHAGLQRATTVASMVVTTAQALGDLVHSEEKGGGPRPGAPTRPGRRSPTCNSNALLGVDRALWYAAMAHGNALRPGAPALSVLVQTTGPTGDGRRATPPGAANANSQHGNELQGVEQELATGRCKCIYSQHENDRDERQGRVLYALCCTR